MVVLGLALVVTSSPAQVTAPPARPAATAVDTAPRTLASFAATIERLSEPAGYFDTDNLISNESSYLHVLPRLRTLGVHGGAYIGVGPDQNYSYIAAIRPRIAYLVDVRRDNLLQHLIFRSLFQRSDSRLEYLCRWLGRHCPNDLEAWRERSVESLVAWAERAPVDRALVRAVQADLLADAAATGVPISDADRATIVRFHDAFVREGVALRFTSHGRAPQPYYPTLRDLVLARDAAGASGSYLARDADWRFVRSLHAANRIIPLVGNLAGSRTLAGIAREIVASGDTLAAVYTSNVEYYLWGSADFDAWARNATALRRSPRSVIIRSYFGRQFGTRHPLAVPGFSSVQLLHRLDDFAARRARGGWASYLALVTDDAR